MANVIDQALTGRPDVGCDQFADGPVSNRPLTAADVGPSWMDRRPPKDGGR